MQTLKLDRAEGDPITASFKNKQHHFKGDSRVKRFLSVLVASMFLASAAYAADTKEEKKAEPAKADAKAKAGDTKGDAKSAEKKADPAKGGEKAKGEAKGDVKASEKAKDAKAGAMGEEKKAASTSK
jgi:hypothetical protein